MNNETLTFAVDGLAFSVKFDRWDALQNDRARWCWRIQETDFNHGWPIPSKILVENDDLTTVGESPSAAEALKTLATFLSAWLEAVEHYERTGNQPENFSLFPYEILRRIDNDNFDQILTGLIMALGDDE